MKLTKSLEESLKEHYLYCTGEIPKSSVIFQVSYKNWLDVWTVDDKQFKNKSSAVNHSKKIAKERALNGRVTIFANLSDPLEASKLEQNINKF